MMDAGEMIELGASDIQFAKLGNEPNEERMNGLLGSFPQTQYSSRIGENAGSGPRH